MRNKTFFLISIIFLFISYLFIFIFYFLGTKSINLNPENRLLEMQIDKINIINSSNNKNIIFLGDSSLGNSINASLWKNKKNLKTFNLALYGTLSYAGAYAVLENLNLKKIEKVYVMGSYYNWSQNPSRGYNYINSAINNQSYIRKIFTQLNLRDFIKLLKININYISKKSLGKIFFYVDERNIENDYIQQINEKKITKKILKNDVVKLSGESFNINKVKYLQKIFDVCKSSKIECIYLNGPIYNEICELDSFKEYLEKIKDILKKKNINKFNYDNCINYKLIGDQNDHIIANYKNQFTKNLNKLIEK